MKADWRNWGRIHNGGVVGTLAGGTVSHLTHTREKIREGSQIAPAYTQGHFAYSTRSRERRSRKEAKIFKK